MTNEEIKRCPFCGGLAFVSQLPKVKDEIKSGTWVIGCDGNNGCLCPCYFYKLTPFYTSKELAIRMWNQRNE